MTQVLPRRYRPSARRPEVVACLVADGSAARVAAAAVEEARTRGLPVRFVLVAPEAAQPGDDPLTAALRAVGSDRPVRPTVEVVAGDPVPLLVRRSANAAVLVLPDDPADGVAVQCQRLVACPIQLVAS